MRPLHKFVLWSALLVMMGGVANAGTLSLSAAGQFSSTVTSTQLTGPSALWSLSFAVDSNPVAGNADQLGFDAPFTSFTYSLNNSVVAAAPASIRFSTASDLGMFTVFFGPESGFVNGVPVPEFSFQGAQLFSGSTTNPTLLAGAYPVSEFIYSDAVNYDDHLPADFSLSVTNVPEPSPLTASLLGLILVGFSQIYRFRKKYPR